MTAIHVYEETFTLDHPRTRVFGALTEPAQLRVWFTEHAEIGAEPGSPFRFWGKHTAHVLDETLADQTLTAYQNDRSLAFTWTWGGVPTRVAIEFHDKGSGASLRVRHEADGEVAGHKPGEIKWLMEDFWHLSVGNLREYLRTGAPALLADHTPGRQDVEVAIDIDAPASVVWRCLTEPDQLDRWLSEKATIDLRVGGEYSYGWEFEGDCTGPTRILELEPERRLVHDWSYIEDKSTRTEWTLDPKPSGGTRVTIRQINTVGSKEFSGYTNGWAKFLLKLRDIAQGG